MTNAVGALMEKQYKEVTKEHQVHKDDSSSLICGKG